MMAIARAAGHHGREGSTRRASAPVPWRRLAWVTWRQHRRPLAAILLVMTLAAVALLLTGVPMHEAAARESGTSRLAWTQGASRSRWFIARVAIVIALLAIAAAGLALELSWWFSPLGFSDSWAPWLFDLLGLSFAGWVTMGFSLGVFLGAVIRRTVPATAATMACYALLLYETSTSWRMAYLALLHRIIPNAQIGPGGGFSYGISLSSGRGPDLKILSAALGWPDGRLLSNSQLGHPTAWRSCSRASACG